MSINFSNYGQERERIATEAELEIFDIICSLSGDAELDLVRKSDDYITVVLGEWDLARIKYTPRAKWVIFPLAETRNKKLRIEEPGDVANFEDYIRSSLEIINKYL